MRSIGAYLALGIFWLMHWLPLPVLRASAGVFGHLLFYCARSRKHVGRVNLRLCFPAATEAWREALLRRHFVLFTQAAFDRAKMFWSPLATITDMTRIIGMDELLRLEGEPVILMGIHNVGLEFGGVGIALRLQTPLSLIYSVQSNPVINKAMVKGRGRFNHSILFERQHPLRGVVKTLRQGHPLCYFPDQDFGPRDSIFLPFFGVPAATITGTSRLARMAGARIVPVVTRLTPRGYDIELFPAWENFPSDSLAADALRINAFIEEQVLQAPEQYFWLHKRFKTRPPGEADFYAR